MSLSDRCSGSDLVCLCVRACVCVCVGVCACVCLYVYVSLWVFIGVGGLVCFIMLFLASVRHFVLLLKYEKCHINKFDLI